nr:membrane glycoprotein E64 [Elephant endotheliotropic herpesvirus 1A]
MKRFFLGGGKYSLQLSIYTCGKIVFIISLCAAENYCKHDDGGEVKNLTVTGSGGHVNITLQLEDTGTHTLLIHNDSTISSSSKLFNVKINETHLILSTSCSTASGKYLLQIFNSSLDVSCQHFYVISNCTFPIMSTYTAQSSCSGCKYTIFTLTPFIVIFSLIVEF